MRAKSLRIRAMAEQLVRKSADAVAVTELVEALREHGDDDAADAVEEGDYQKGRKLWEGWFDDGKGNTGDPVGPEEIEIFTMFDDLGTTTTLSDEDWEYIISGEPRKGGGDGYDD